MLKVFLGRIVNAENAVFVRISRHTKMICVHEFENPDFCEDCNASSEIQNLKSELEIEKNRVKSMERIVYAAKNFVEDSRLLALPSTSIEYGSPDQIHVMRIKNWQYAEKELKISLKELTD